MSAKHLPSDTMRIDAPDLELSYCPDVIADAQDYVTQLRAGIAWQQTRITLFGRTHAVPRLTAWYGDAGISYRYSGLSLSARGWTPVLERLRRLAENYAQQAFNGVLLNRYRDGQDSMGWHSDDEPELGTEPVIASLSLGATRRLRLRHRQRRDLAPISLDLEAGSLLLMRGATQAHWQHCLPKTRRTVEERINLTFRHIVPC